MALSPRLIVRMPAPALRGVGELHVDVNTNWLDPVRFLATSGNLTTDFNTGDVYDGLTIAAGDPFLYQPVSAGASVPGTTVGIYTAGAGAPVRRADANTGAELVGAAVLVRQGSGAGQSWICVNSDPPVIGSDTITFRYFSTGFDDSDKIPFTQIGVAGGVAGLNSDIAVVQRFPGFVKQVPDAEYSSTTGTWSGTPAHTETQSRIDRHAYNLIGDEVRLPNGRWLIGRSLNLGYGDASHSPYATARLRGSGVAFNADAFAGTALGANFSDEPMVNIQGARFSELSDIALSGPNRQWIQDHDLGTPTVPASLPPLDDKLIASWINPALDARADSRYAPYAIIAVDGRIGPPQTDHYRDVDYSFLGGGIAQYDKAPSTRVLIQRFHLRGGYVGIVVQPNSGVWYDANGDDVTIMDGIIADCAVGIHVSQTQARCTSVINVKCSKVHTALSTSMFGRQTGRFGPVFNFHAEHFINYFDFASTSITGSTALIGCYGEAGYRIGNVNASTSVEQEISLIDCDFHFDDQNPAATGRGTPATLLSGAASGAGQLFPLRVLGGSWMSFYGVAFINLSIEGVVIDGLVLRSDDPSLDAAAVPMAHKCARNGFAGGLCFPALGFGQRITKINPKWIPFDLDTGAVVAAPSNIGDRFRSSRKICTPLWAERHCAATSSTGDPGVIVPRTRVQGLDLGSLGLSLTGITITGTLPSYFTEDVRMTQGGMPGDVILISASNTVAVIETLNTSTRVFTAKLINNYRVTGPVEPVTVSGGVGYLGCMRYYSPALPVYGVFTSGSPIIADISTSPTGAAVSPNIAANIAAGDYIVVDESLVPFLAQATAKIAPTGLAVATQITLIGNAIGSSGSQTIVATGQIIPGRGPGGSDRVRIGTLSRAL